MSDPTFQVATSIVSIVAGVLILSTIILAVVVTKICCGKKEKELRFGNAFKRQYNDNDGDNQLIGDDEKNTQLNALLADERKRLLKLNQDLSEQTEQDAYVDDQEAVSGLKMVDSIRELQRENRNLNDCLERAKREEKRSGASVIVPTWNTDH